MKTTQPLSETKGDLFELAPPGSAIAHCVSADLHMGKGIAVGFKKNFGGVTALRAQNKRVGQVAILTTLSRTIFYLITKQKYYQKPTMESLKACLIEMRREMIERKLTSVAMPRIGCGLDRLDWSSVRALLEELFGEAGIHVHVFYL